MKILVCVAHPDDEVLMCGATIARHTTFGDEARVLVLADGVSSREGATVVDFNERLAMASKASDILGCSGEFVGLKDQQLDTYPLLDIIRHITKRVEEFQPDTVFTHWHGDLNNDHRIVSDATMVACRPGCSVKTILMGEVPSTTEWAGGFKPNCFVDVGGFMHSKISAMKCYEPELRKLPHPRSLAGIDALATYRGATAGVQYAEAFEIARTVT